jgi:hypothetical protein
VRKAIVEPVFAYIKEHRGFRRFSLCGLVQVRAEWALIWPDPQPAETLRRAPRRSHRLKCRPSFARRGAKRRHPRSWLH